MKTMIINGESFEIHKSKYTTERISKWLETFVRSTRTALHEFYSKPSEAKKALHVYWMQWYGKTYFDMHGHDMGVFVGSFGIENATCQHVSYAGVLYDFKTCEPIAFIHITKAYNRIYFPAN